MPKLKRTTPCPACPWRVQSAPGYLGDDEPDAFYGKTVDEVAMPCHEAIDYSDPDWRTTQLPDADLCAGGLIHMANIAKLPRDPTLADAVRAVKPSTAVFIHPAQWWAHHAGLTAEEASATWSQRLMDWRVAEINRAEQDNETDCRHLTLPLPSAAHNPERNYRAVQNP